MEEKCFYSASDVAKYMGISIPLAYRIIKDLNQQLKSKGYITVAGRISKKYFVEKVFGYDDMSVYRASV